MVRKGERGGESKGRSMAPSNQGECCGAFVLCDTPPTTFLFPLPPLLPPSLFPLLIHTPSLKSIPMCLNLQTFFSPFNLFLIHSSASSLVRFSPTLFVFLIFSVWHCPWLPSALINILTFLWATEIEGGYVL